MKKKESRKFEMEKTFKKKLNLNIKKDFMGPIVSFHGCHNTKIVVVNTYHTTTKTSDVKHSI